MDLQLSLRELDNQILQGTLNNPNLKLFLSSCCKYQQDMVLEQLNLMDSNSL